MEEEDSFKTVMDRFKEQMKPKSDELRVVKTGLKANRDEWVTLVKQMRVLKGSFDIDEYSACKRGMRNNLERLEKWKMKIRGCLIALEEMDTDLTKYLVSLKSYDFKGEKNTLEELRELEEESLELEEEMEAESSERIYLENASMKYLWKICMLLRYTFRGYFGESKSKKWGHWLEKDMYRMIHRYTGEHQSKEYQSGNAEIGGHTTQLWCALVSDGGRFLFNGDGKYIDVWDLFDACSPYHRWEAHQGAMEYLIIGFGSLISCARDNLIKFWDENTLELTKTLTGHSGDVMMIEFNDTGDKLVSAGRDQSVREWDVESGDCLREFKGHSDEIYSVHYIGDRIISGSHDGTLRVGEPEDLDGLKHDSLVPMTDAVYDTSLSSDGSMFAADCAGRVMFYTIPEWAMVRSVDVSGF